MIIRTNIYTVYSPPDKYGKKDLSLLRSRYYTNKIKIWNIRMVQLLTLSKKSEKKNTVLYDHSQFFIFLNPIENLEEFYHIPTLSGLLRKHKSKIHYGGLMHEDGLSDAM